MAGRDITIPFGPDRTGEFDLSAILPEVETTAADASPEQVDEIRADGLPDSAFEAAPAQAFTYERAEEDTGSAPELVSGVNWDSLEANAAAAEAEAAAEAAEQEESGEPGGAAAALGGVQASLSALKDSIGQGRELKARERERDEFAEKLEADREELADREDILQNYFALAAEQDNIIRQNTQQREALKDELALLVAQQEETSSALENMRAQHDEQLAPLETALGRAKAAAEQTKNDERSRKSELNSAESDKRRAGDGDDAAMAAARLDVIQQAYDEAVTRSESAKDELNRVQRRYDDLRERIEQSEAPLERSLKDLSEKIDALKEDVNRLGDTISTATKRRQYCDTVYQYPDETAKLREEVASGDETVRRMDEENDELRDLLADSRQRSRTAKLVIAGVILLIIVLIILFAFVLK